MNHILRMLQMSADAGLTGFYYWRTEPHFRCWTCCESRPMQAGG
jgi:hypothetical protein